MKNPHTLSALEALRAMGDGSLSSEQLVQSCLKRIRELEDTIGAWAYLDGDYALEQARETDRICRQGDATGPLHGIPVGIKDIIDTADMPTERGSILYSGRRPGEDATVVRLLRKAGAIIMGKTVTAELATFSPGKTRNPHNPEHTPGGSSSGSAAAVACSMVPLSLATQTGGSIIRPASFCGIFGYKPSHGLISRHGVLAQSQILDTIGVYGRTLGDAALIADVLMCFDDRDAAMTPGGHVHLTAALSEELPDDPRFCFIRTPAWNHAGESTRNTFGKLIKKLNEEIAPVEQVDLPSSFDDIIEVQKLIMETDISRSYAGEYKRGKDQLSKQLCGQIERGREVRAVDYESALARIREYKDGLNLIACDFDAMLTPATTGEAPFGLESTGSPVFNSMWTLCGTPALTLPILKGPTGLPLGVQVIGPGGDDAGLLRDANWLMQRITPISWKAGGRR